MYVRTCMFYTYRTDHFVIKVSNGDTGKGKPRGRHQNLCQSDIVLGRIYPAWASLLSLSLSLPLSPSLSLSPFSANFPLLWFPGTYVGTIDVQLTWARHGRASVWCSCWVASLLRVGEQCLAVLSLYCVFSFFLKHISSQIIKIQVINKLMAAAICQK